MSRDDTFVLRETNNSLQFKSEFKGHAHLCKFTGLLTLSSWIIQVLSPMSLFEILKKKGFCSVTSFAMIVLGPLKIYAKLMMQ